MTSLSLFLCLSVIFTSTNSTFDSHNPIPSAHQIPSRHYLSIWHIYIAISPGPEHIVALQWQFNASSSSCWVNVCETFCLLRDPLSLNWCPTAVVIHYNFDSTNFDTLRTQPGGITSRGLPNLNGELTGTRVSRNAIRICHKKCLRNAGSHVKYNPILS